MTNRVKLERVVDVEQFRGMLHVIDYRVALHSILDAGRSLRADLPEPLLAGWIANSWRQLLMRGPTCLQYLGEHTVLLLDDSKLNGKYWRNELYAEYKAKAKRKALQDVGEQVPRLSISYGQVRDIGYVVAEELCLPLFTEPLYEADDWAGAVHRLAKAKSLRRAVMYSTIDKDWMQLVDNATMQWWCGSTDWGVTRLHNEAEVRNFVWQRMQQRIIQPSQLASVLQKLGDKADNLPAGAPLELFDLCAEHSTYKLPGQAHLLSRMRAEANTSTYVLQKAQNWCEYHSLPQVT